MPFFLSTNSNVPLVEEVKNERHKIRRPATINLLTAATEPTAQEDGVKMSGHFFGIVPSLLP